jgi:zinc transport system substrate-binding protein
MATAQAAAVLSDQISYQEQYMSKIANHYIVKLLLLVFSLLFLSACGSQPGKNNAHVNTDKSIIIDTTFFPIYIDAMNITKDVPGVKLVNIAPPATGCLHDYQLTPDDLKNMSEADILIINGAGMESFTDKISSQLPDLKIVDASRGISLIKSGENDYNPHVWVSITNSIRQVKNIGEQLAVLDPDHAAQYASNTEVYSGKLEDLRIKMHQAVDNAGSREIVTFHEAFPYFAQEFNLNITAVIEREPGSEPSAAEMAETIKIIENSGTRILFAEPQYPAKSAETIARETGTKVYILDPAVTGIPDPDAYLNIMENNMKTLHEALNQNE